MWRTWRAMIARQACSFAGDSSADSSSCAALRIKVPVDCAVHAPSVAQKDILAHVCFSQGDLRVLALGNIARGTEHLRRTAIGRRD